MSCAGLAPRSGGAPRGARLAAPVVAAVLAACPAARPKPAPTPDGIGASESDESRRQRLIAELKDEILTSYARDTLPDVETLMIPPEVGPARIGVGPGDFYVGEEVAKLASSRWPLQIVPGTPTTVRSKKLEIHLSQDKHVSAAWTSDELSWRITLCQRTAVIPLRITALFAHDGDRWVEVYEHLSFGRMPQATGDGELRGRKDILDAAVDRDLSDTYSRLLSGLLSAQSTRVKLTVAVGARDPDRKGPAPTFLLGPDPDGDWYGTEQVESVRLVDGKVTLDVRRVGTIDRPGKATIGYWVGNLVADLDHHPGTAASKVLLRGSFTFEKRDDKWVIVQGHLSQPIDDIDLAQIVYGTALISEKPLQITCDDGRRSAAAGTTSTVPAPAAAP